MPLIRTALVAAFVTLGVTCAEAQIGEQTTRIVVPYPPGGAGDAIARMIADSMRVTLARIVIVENKSGAGGRIGVQSVKGAKADGSVLLFTPIAPMVMFPLVYENLGYDPAKDFVPLSQLATFDLGVAAGASVPVTSLAGLVDWLRANPAKANYGSPAAGSIPHLFAVMFKEAVNIDLQHVPYNGNSQALVDLAGGHLPIFFTSTQDLVGPHRAGRLRVLATSGQSRAQALPEVQTFAEAGYAIHGHGWFGMYAPAHTPADTAARLSDAIVAAVRSPAVQKRMIELYLRPTGTTSAEFAAIQQADTEHWKPAVKASGFKPD